MMPRRTQPPGFLIIGAQKCGTSWLHQHLSTHPELWLPPGKELEFFSYSRHLDDPGLDAYRANFDPAGERLAGEATASYFWTASDSPWCRQPAGFQTDIPGVVRQALGADVRLIVLLRDPVERALSAWAHYVRHGEVDPSLPFQQAAHHGGIVDMGFYGRHFAAWRKHFPVNQFLVLTLEEDIVARPEQALAQVLTFLGCRSRQPKADAKDLATAVFPGLQRERAEDGSVHIPLQDGGSLVVTTRELNELAATYQPDVERLRTLLPGESLGRGWLKR